MTATERVRRTVDGVRTTWSAAPSLVAAAELGHRVLVRVPDAVVDVRATGAQVRVATDEQAQAVSGAAGDLGLTAGSATP